MKESRFDHRLDSILRAARVRLMERLRYAYFHGRAQEYLEEIHLVPGLAPVLLHGKLLPLERAAADLLGIISALRGAKGISRATSPKCTCLTSSCGTSTSRPSAGIVRISPSSAPRTKRPPSPHRPTPTA